MRFVVFLSGLWSRKNQWRTNMGVTADWSDSGTGHPYCLTRYGGSNPLYVSRNSQFVKHHLTGVNWGVN